VEIKFCSTVPTTAKTLLGEQDRNLFFAHFRKNIEVSLEAGHMSNFGPLYDKLAKELHFACSLNEEKFPVVTSSGHTALMTAFHCLEIKKPIIPCYTFESTRLAATSMGIEPIIADVDIKTGALSLSYISSLPEDSYDSLVVVTPLSAIPDLKKYEVFCRERGKRLVIDGAATFGTKGVFNYGDAYCISFHATKSFPVGEAGAVFLNKGLIDTAKRFITFGLDSEKTPSGFGLNAKVSEYTCALALSLLAILSRYTIQRQRNTFQLKSELKCYRGDAVAFLSSVAGVDTAYQSFPIYMSNSSAVLSHLNASGVSSIRYYKPLVDDPARFPNTHKLYNSNVCIPVHSDLAHKHIDYMVKRILEV